MKATKGLWKWRAMGNEENQKQVSLVSHSPLEIAGAIPTFPQPRRRPRGKVEIQQQDSHFPVAVSLSQETQKRRIPLNAGFPVVQAHRSIRICSEAERPASSESRWFSWAARRTAWR